MSQQIYTAQRMMGMVHAAMFDAVNSIERRYQPYLVQLPADPATSKEAAAAAAAAAVLATINEKIAGEMKATLASYLASIPDDGAAKADGIKLGEAVAAKVLEGRANDGHDAVDDYRPRTTPGVYVPTSITAASTFSHQTRRFPHSTRRSRRRLPFGRWCGAAPPKIWPTSRTMSSANWR